jgi:hypothetical protein
MDKAEFESMLQGSLGHKAAGVIRPRIIKI